MRYIKYFILLLLIIPLDGYAIDFYCSTKVNSGAEFTCTLSNSSNALASLAATLDIPSEITIKNVNISKGYNFTGDYKNLSFIGPGYNAPNSIAVFILQAPSVNNDKTYNISLSNISYKYLKNDKNAITDNKKNANIKVLKTITPSTSSTSTTTTTTSNMPTTNVKNEANIMFDLNGGEGNISNMSCLVEDNKCIIDISNLPSPIKNGYIFKSWSSSSNCNTDLDSNIELNGDITLYACYYKEDRENNPNYLKSLNVSNQIIDFTKFNFEYSVEVENDVSSLNIEAFAEDESANVEISPNAYNLLEGENIINILVIKDNVATSYKLIVTRKGISKKYDDDYIPYLKNLEIDGYQIDFKKDNYFYNLKVKYNTKNLNVLPVLEDDNLQYEIIGNKNLSNGSMIQINVSSPNGVSTHYIINVTYESFINTYIIYIYFIILIIFCLIVYLFIKSKKSKNNNIFKVKQTNKKSAKNKRKKQSENTEILKL